MIVGNGDVAKVLNDRVNVILFASGVSNRKPLTKKECYREVYLLADTIEKLPDCMLVYFSSIDAEIRESEYFSHKLAMEEIIRQTVTNYTIIRLGNITWGDNPNTFINYLRNQADESRNIFDEYRYVIDEHHLRFVTDNLPTTGKYEISIFNRKAKVKDLL